MVVLVTLLVSSTVPLWFIEGDSLLYRMQYLVIIPFGWSGAIQDSPTDVDPRATAVRFSTFEGAMNIHEQITESE